MRLALALAALAALGCQDVDRFDTEDGAAYCGSMISAPEFNEALTPAGVPSRLRLRLELDTDALTTRPGTLTSDDTEGGLCSPASLFDQAPLRAIPEMFHDPLSSFEFGDGREHNFFAWVDSTCQGTVLAVVSLMQNDDVEVRLLKPAADPAEGATPAERPGFGVFILKRRNSGCGF